jgi:phosphatidylglycerol---prolipoprotein diacylglyceryl transferase
MQFIGNPYIYTIASWIGFITASSIYFVLLKPDKRYVIKPVLYLLIIFLTAVIGGRIVQFLILGPLTFRDFFSALFTGNTTVLGGILFGGLTAWGLNRLDQKSVSLDALAASFPFGHAVGRIGCFASGCCFGKICRPGFFTVTYNESWPYYGLLDEGPRVPVQLISSFALLLIGIILIIIYRRRNTWETAGYYLVIYGVFRFFIEFIRDDAVRGFILIMWTGQWFALCFMLVGLIILIWTKVKCSP